MRANNPIKVARWLIPIFVLALVAASCGDDEGATTTTQATATTEAAADDEITLGLVLQNFTNPAIKDVADAAADEAEKHYPNVTVLAQDSTTLEEQVAKAETFIAQGVDALGLQPWEGAAIMPTIEKANEAGIPVFLVQDNAPGAVDAGLAITYIASDETEGGRLVGQWLIEALGNSGEVAIIEGAPGDSPAVNRSDGFLEAVEGSGLDVVARTTANWARDQGLTVATDMLTANPDLLAFFTHNDEMGFGALEAVRAAGKEGEIIVIGYNGTCIGIEATVNGEFQSEGILFLDTVGREFVRSAVTHLGGGSVDPRIQPPIAVLDTADMQAVLDGSMNVDDLEGLKGRIETAAAGGC
jgi:ABC-type sugar transport system substrate-binding protein